MVISVMKVTFKDIGYNEETCCFESEFDYGEGRKSISRFCGDKTIFDSIFAHDCRIMHDKNHLRAHLIEFGLSSEEYNKILNEIYKGYEHLPPRSLGRIMTLI